MKCNHANGLEPNKQTREDGVQSVNKKTLSTMILFFLKNLNLGSGQAICVSMIVFIVQILAGYCSLDSDHMTCIIMLLILSIIQFPIFLLVLSTFLVPSNGVAENVAVFFFSTYCLKFYAISLAYSILAYHVLTGHRWFWRKYVLYLFLNIVFLMLTRLCFDFPSKKHLLFVPIEIAFSLWTYFLLIRKYERNLQVDDGCKTNL